MRAFVLGNVKHDAVYVGYGEVRDIAIVAIDVERLGINARQCRYEHDSQDKKLVGFHISGKKTAYVLNRFKLKMMCFKHSS